MSSIPRRQRHPAPVARLRAGTEGPHAGTSRRSAQLYGPGRYLRRGIITTGYHLIPLVNWLLARVPIPAWAFRYFVACPFCDTIRSRLTDPCPECKL